MSSGDNRLVVIDEDGNEKVLYEPLPHQIAFHASTTPNLLGLGTRGTGKSTQLRNDAILRCLMVPNFHALIVRRTMPELRRALALDTILPTPTGWTTMGSVQVGDQLLACDGTPTRVIDKSAPHIDSEGTYRLTFDTGETIIASAQHLWVVRNRSDRSNGTGPRVVTTADIAARVHTDADGRANWSIDLADEWDLPEVDLPVPPYVLGAWLGDGTTGFAEITTVDAGILATIEACGYRTRRRPSKVYGYGMLDNCVVDLRRAGVLHEKHVPDVYLFASALQRRSLLQGLLDTDGWARSDGLICFGNTNRKLIDAVYTLVASLGYKPRITVRPPHMGGLVRGHQIIGRLPMYAVQWAGDASFFQLERKKQTLAGGRPIHGPGSKAQANYIVACDRIEPVVCQCVSVDHPTETYLVGRGSIVTHNSHLVFIDAEMKALGGVFLHTHFLAKFPNGSTITFGHCESDKDILNYLSSQYFFIGFDELSTFSLNQFLQISAAARAPAGSGCAAVIRATSNPLGIGSEWMKAWFVDKNVRLEEYPDYHPDDFEMQFSTLEDNPHLDRKAYAARLRNLPEHVRRAWLLGEFVVEGMYFTDFQQKKMLEGSPDPSPWHVLDEMPTYRDQSLLDYPHLNVYRAIDWGYFPDPAVCLWIAVLPNKRAIVFKERSWRKTLAEDVAKQIKAESEGMHVVESFCDPSMYVKTGETVYSIGEIFEQNRVPLTVAANKRELYGYSIHSYLNTLIDGTPQVQMVRYGCPDLIRTIPTLRIDESNPNCIADGEDHWAVSLAYFCMSNAAPSRDPVISAIPRWLQPKRRLGLHATI